jgi:group I intron endonuclease
MSAIIYRITNTVNGKCYVGQTIQGLVKRWRGHCYAATRGSVTYLHKAIQKYGSVLFTVELVEETTVEQLNDRERYWIAEFQPAYNMTEGGEGTRGHSPSAEHRFKISKANNGKIHTPETRAKISMALRGEKNPNYDKILSQEHKDKLLESRRGKSHSLEARNKLRDINRGKILSAETRSKISNARRGNPLSEKHRQKIGEAIRGNKHPLYGKSCSAETRAKISAAAKKRYANKKMENS